MPAIIAYDVLTPFGNRYRVTAAEGREAHDTPGATVTDRLDGGFSVRDSWVPKGGKESHFMPVRRAA